MGFRTSDSDAPYVPFMADMTEKNSSLRLVFLSGDWIPVSLPDELKENFENVRVVSLGGATESTIWSNYYIILIRSAIHGRAYLTASLCKMHVIMY